MATGCRYFELYDEEAGDWTHWGEKVQEVMPFGTSMISDTGRITDRLDADPTEAARRFRERYGIPSFEEAPASLAEDYSRSHMFRFKLLAMKVFLEDHGITGECPHEPYGETDRCLYHLSKAAKADLGIEASEVKRALLDDVASGDETGARDLPPNFFVGARIRRLELENEILDSEDNHPINLDLADIDALSISRVVIEQGFQINRGEIGSVDVSRTKIRMDASFVETRFRGDLVFEDVTVSEGEVNFEGARVEAADADATNQGRVSFENATFAGRQVSFRNATFGVDAVNFSSTDFDGRRALFSNAEFAGDVDFDNASFTGERTNFEAVEVGGDARFAAATFRDQVTNFLGLRVGGTAAFSSAGFDQRTMFKSATFAGDADFDRTTFDDREANFAEVAFEGPADFSEAEFGSGARFSEATFDESATFEAATYRDHEAKFADVAFAGPASFAGADFDAGVSFEGTAFGAGVDLSTASFDGRAAFADARIEGRADLGETAFAEGGAFDDVVVRGATARFSYLEQQGGILSFEGAEFHAGARFDSARFAGRETDFSDASFEAGPDDVAAAFRDSKFLADRAVFDRVEFRDGDVVFDSAVFADCTASFRDVSITASRARDQTAGFNDVTVTGGTLEMRGVRTATERYALTEKGEAFAAHGFPERRIQDAIDATGETTVTQLSPQPDREGTADGVDVVDILDRYPLGEDPLVTDGVITTLREGGWIELPEGATPTAPVEATDPPTRPAEQAVESLAAGEAGSVRATLFEELAARGLVTSEERASATPIEFNKSRVESGAFVQPGVAADDDAAGQTTVYEMEGCHVGDVELRARDDQRVFDCFEFLDTTFEGFDFNDHQDELSRNQWRIHRTISDSADSLSVLSKVVQSVLVAPPPIRKTTTDAPSKLEASYLKAKNGADDVGANSAASAFFQQELQYRRLKHRGNVGFDVEGLRALYNYGANMLLGVTSGYGEQPRRVIVFSLMMIGAFGVLFQFVWASSVAVSPPEYQGLSGALILSFESFTTLVLGGGSVDNVLIRYIAYGEGFVGAFLIALFVFTLTRSVHR